MVEEDRRLMVPPGSTKQQPVAQGSMNKRNLVRQPTDTRTSDDVSVFSFSETIPSSGSGWLCGCFSNKRGASTPSAEQHEASQRQRRRGRRSDQQQSQMQGGMSMRSQNNSARPEQLVDASPMIGAVSPCKIDATYFGRRTQPQASDLPAQLSSNGNRSQGYNQTEFRPLKASQPQSGQGTPTGENRAAPSYGISLESVAKHP
ncbi:hypothetical protein I317_02615 [Kwoniella heveanensis CBS 569]|nr:hypothetical protein I317_02615 [Kwoniella heveanensis CBS 569]